MAPEDRNYQIMPMLRDGRNGTTHNQGLDACGLFTVFGFGILWGTAVLELNEGDFRAACHPNGQAIWGWRFGRIEIGMLKGPLPEDL